MIIFLEKSQEKQCNICTYLLGHKNVEDNLLLHIALNTKEHYRFKFDEKLKKLKKFEKFEKAFKNFIMKILIN